MRSSASCWPGSVGENTTVSSTKPKGGIVNADVKKDENTSCGSTVTLDTRRGEKPQTARCEISFMQTDIAPIRVMAFEIVAMKDFAVDEDELPDAGPGERGGNFRSKRAEPNNTDSLRVKVSIFVAGPTFGFSGL